MSWETPKTNWAIHLDSAGNYEGDFFNAYDYNRIKNNLLYIRDLAIQIYGVVPEIVVGPNKYEIDVWEPNWENDNYFAWEFNAIEDGIETLGELMDFVDIGDKKTFYDNGKFIDYVELNRLESALLKMYNVLSSAISHKSRLAFRLGSGKFKI